MKYFMLGIHFISFFKKNIFFLCFIHAVIQLTGGGMEKRALLIGQPGTNQRTARLFQMSDRFKAVNLNSPAF